MSKNNLVLIRGGGDLASGVALRLHHVGIKIVITELPQPLAVRRAVSFSEAVYEGSHEVEGIQAQLIKLDQLSAGSEADVIPVIVDPMADVLSSGLFCVVVDARLIKRPPAPLPVEVPLHIGLGPGFRAGSDCHAVIETRRSHSLGRVYWAGTTQPDSGQPEGDPRRVLRAPADGILLSHAKIGEHVEVGQEVAEVHSTGENHHAKITSPLTGVLRGLIREGTRVSKGLKIGDIDVRDDSGACFLVSDKALAVGGGVLEAILSKPEVRQALFP